MQAQCDNDTLGLRNAGMATQAFAGSTEVRGASFGLVAALAGGGYLALARAGVIGGIGPADLTLLGAARTALFPSLVPVLAILIGVPLTGEVPDLVQFAGLALVTAGLLAAIYVLRWRQPSSSKANVIAFDEINR